MRAIAGIEEIEGQKRKSIVEHVEIVGAKLIQLIRQRGADAGDSIEGYTHEKQLELDEFEKVFNHYNSLMNEIAVIDDWYISRDAVIAKCTNKLQQQILDQNAHLEEEITTAIHELLVKQFADLFATREVKGTMEQDPQFSYLGDLSQIRAKFDSIVQLKGCRGSLSEHMLALADEILNLHAPNDIQKEKRLHRKREMLQAEKEECEMNFRRYKMVLLEINSLDQWCNERNMAVDLQIQATMDGIKLDCPSISGKKLSEISLYLQDTLISIKAIVELRHVLAGDANFNHGRTLEEVEDDLNGRYALSPGKSIYKIDEGGGGGVKGMFITLFLYTGGVLLLWSGALDSSHVLLSYPLMPLASPMTNMLISTLKPTHLHLHSYILTQRLNQCLQE